MEVTLCGLSGESLATLDCEATNTVEQLKSRLCDIVGVPRQHLCLLQLVHGKTLLQDSTRIAEIDSKASCQLTLLRAPSSRLGELPEFNGLYIGYEEEEWHDSMVQFEVVIDSADWFEASAPDEDGDCQVEGVLYYRILSIAGYVGGTQLPSGWNDPKLRGREFVRGLLSADRSLTVAGYLVEPRRGMIDPNPTSYEFTVDEDGSKIVGAFTGREGERICFEMHRMTEEEASAWRAERSSDIRACQHALADEIRKANRIDSEENPNRVVAEDPLSNESPSL